MSKKYNKTFTNLKTVVNDTSILNAQKILVNTSSDNVTERTNIVDYIGDSVDKLKEKINSRVDDLEQNTVILNTKVEKLYDTYDSYDTLDFAYGIELGHCDTSSFRLGYNHTPNGIIRKVSLYARNTSGNNHDCYTNGCYLLVQKYNKATSELISSACSTNKVVVQRNDTSSPLLNTWEFEGFESCNEGEVLKFIPTSGDTQIANYNIGIAVDSNHTHTDCNVGGDTFVDGVNTTPLGEGNKWVAYVQFEGDFYRESDFKTHPNDSSKHLKPIERPVIESLYTTATVEIWNNNINNVSLGNASCKGFKLERPYISNCVFNEMRWTTTSGTEDCTCYLKVTLNDTKGKEICSYFSNNTESFNSTGLKSFRFNEDIEITDKIGSITCEVSLDGINVVTTESKRIRVASVGTSVNNTTDGSELTNANIITHVIFYGNKPTSLLTSHIGDDTHLTTVQKDTISDCTNLNYTTILESEATESGEFDAVHFNYQDVPHDFCIKKFILKPIESSNTPLYMAVWTLTQSGQKTYVGLSDEAITWEAGKDAVWTFNNVELIVPANHNVEFFLCTGADAVGESKADAPGVYIKTKYNPDGRGTIRHSNNWHSRCIQATFSNNGYLSHVGDDSHLTTEQKNAITDYTNSKNSFAAKSQVDLTYAKNATLFGAEYRTATGNDNTQSWSAVRIPSAYVPHLQPIHEVKLTTLNTNETTPMYLGAVAISDNEQQRQLLKLSTNAVIWTADSEVIWEFGKEGFIIPIGYQLELYLVANESDFVLPIPSTDVLLQSSMNGSIGVGKFYPIEGTWGGPRLLDCVLLTNAHINNNDHLSAEDRELLDNLANGYVENLYTNSVNILEDGEVIDTSTPVTVTVDEITVDANVTAQNRMARAILVMEEEETVQWLSSDGAVVTLTKSQLKQALKTAVGNEINNWIGA